MKVGDLVKMNIDIDFLPEPGWDMWGIGTVVAIEFGEKQYESLAAARQYVLPQSYEDIEIVIMWSKLDDLSYEALGMLEVVSESR